MVFDLARNTQNDQDMIKKLIQEQIEIAGVECKYYPIDFSTFKGMGDKHFVGEDVNIKWMDPYIIKAILLEPPEAARMFQMMGLTTTDTINISIEKEMILATIGRRPMPRDRITLIYNDSNYEITNILEVPPTTLWEAFMIQINAQKVIESYEDREFLYTEYITPSGQLGMSAIPISAQDDLINTLHITSESGAIESAASAKYYMSGASGWGRADSEIFGRW